MRVCKIVIRPDPDAPDLAQGYAWARTAQEARNLVDTPDVLVFEKHSDMMCLAIPQAADLVELPAAGGLAQGQPREIVAVWFGHLIAEGTRTLPIVFVAV